MDIDKLLNLSVVSALALGLLTLPACNGGDGDTTDTDTATTTMTTTSTRVVMRTSSPPGSSSNPMRARST